MYIPEKSVTLTFFQHMLPHYFVFYGEFKYVIFAPFLPLLSISFLLHVFHSCGMFIEFLFLLLFCLHPVSLDWFVSWFVVWTVNFYI